MIYSYSQTAGITGKTGECVVNQYSTQNPPSIADLENNVPGAVFFNFANDDVMVASNIEGLTQGVDGTYYVDWGIALPKGYYQIVFQKYVYNYDEYTGVSFDISCVLIQQDTSLPSPVSPLDITNKKAYLQTFPVQWADDDDYKQCILDFLNIISSCLINQNVWLQAIAQKSTTVELEELVNALLSISQILEDKDFNSDPIIINTEHDEPWRHV